MPADQGGANAPAVVARAEAEPTVNRGRFTPLNQPANKPGRRKKSVLYAGQIRDLEDRLANNLPAVAEKMMAIALGQATEHLINHKTGETVEVPVNPATQLKAQQYVIERIMGRPESVTKHDIGEAAAEIFQIRIGPAAQAEWDCKAAAVEADVRELGPGEGSQG